MPDDVDRRRGAHRANARGRAGGGGGDGEEDGEDMFFDIGDNKAFRDRLHRSNLRKSADEGRAGVGGLGGGTGTTFTVGADGKIKFNVYGDDDDEDDDDDDADDFQARANEISSPQDAQLMRQKRRRNRNELPW